MKRLRRGSDADRFPAQNGAVPYHFTMSTIPEPSGAGKGREVDTSVILKALLRRWKMVAIILVAFVAAVYVFTALQPKQYSAQVKMLIGDRQRGSEGGSAGDLPVLNMLLAAGGTATSETYADLLQQSPVADEVIRRLNLPIGIGALLGKISVRPVTQTSLLVLRVSWSDPDTAARIANTFADVFIERQRGMAAHQADTAIKFLDEQIPEAQRKMQVASEALAAYQIRTGIADLSQQTQTDITQLANIESKQKQAEIDAQQARAQLGTVEGELNASPATIVGSQSVSANPVVAQLQTKIADLQVQLDAARQTYTDEHPTVIGLKSSLQEARRQLQSQPAQVMGGTSTVPNPVRQGLLQQAGQLQAQAAGAEAQAALLSKQRAQLRPKIEHLPNAARRIGDLQRAAKSTESIYDALQKKKQEALISRSTALSDVTVTAPANPNVWSVTPNMSLNLLVGTIVGLIVAISAAFLAEFFDDRFGSEQDVQDRLGLPVLASVPALDQGDWRTSQWIKPLSVEAYYQLVAALRFSADNPPRIVAFASPDQGDGKSTVAVNTAISIGLMGGRVLIVDGDLRRPTIHQKLNLKNDKGLGDILIGRAKFPDAVQSTAHRGVFALTSGRPAPNPVGLLQSSAFDRVLKAARDRFDFIILDTPALRSIVDGVILANKANGTVLVVTSQRTDAKSVQGAVAKLRSFGSVDVLGIVLNRVKRVARNTSDYYMGAGQSKPLQRTSGVG
ncbi:MAG: polysaccharide biosynthesis tyrosine autokinase [Candidatus Eremiobacteraeota bacterium]|nr:polysaccharide biosynthesis tyrosine autokinase [Candidatus Eremiobacteraeota bacterium]